MGTYIQLREKEQICEWVLVASKGYSGDDYLIRITWSKIITRQFEASEFAEYIAH